MKITLLCRELYRLGGLEKWARLLAASFMERDCDVTILTHDLSDPPFQCHTIPKRGLFSFTRLRNYDADCRAWLKNNPSDVVFGLDRHSYQTHYRAGNGVHKVYLKNRQRLDGYFKTFLNPLHRTILNLEKETFESPSLKCLFTNSFMVRDEILANYTCDRSKIEVVHNGVEWEALNIPFQKCTKESGHLLFIGHGYQRKGLMQLLEALQHVKSRKWSLSVVGRDKDEMRYVETAKRLGIQERVTFFGAKTDLTPFFQRADTLIIPSLYDPFANVTLEALAMGLFVLSSPFNGGKEVLTPQTGAIIPDLFDTQSFASTIEMGLDQQKDPQHIRESVKHYTTTNQLAKMVEKTLNAP